MQKEGGFNKQYEALICGKLSEPKGTFVDYLKKDGRTNTSAVVPSDACKNTSDYRQTSPDKSTVCKPQEPACWRL